jgi:hypothetical protein
MVITDIIVLVCQATGAAPAAPAGVVAAASRLAALASSPLATASTNDDSNSLDIAA